MGRFLPIDVGLWLIIPVLDLVIADRSRVAFVAVHAALPGIMVVGDQPHLGGAFQTVSGGWIQIFTGGRLESILGGRIRSIPGGRFG